MPTEPPARGRPPVTTQAAIEQASLDLLTARGYDHVTVAELASNAGVGRATFFRYFPTKAAVVWWGFDRAIDRLEQALEEADDSTATLVAVRAAIAASVRAAIDPDGVWWERFLILDTVPSLAGEGALRWERWRTTIATFVARRMNLDRGHPLAAAVAGAHFGSYLASLRQWPGRPGHAESMLSAMLTDLEKLGNALEPLVAAEPGP